MLKHRTEQRIKEGFRQLVIQPLADQLRVVPSCFPPRLTVSQHVLGKGALQPVERLLDFFTVQVDPRGGGLLRFTPGGIAKTAAGI